MIRNARKRLTLIALFGSMLAGIFGCHIFDDSSSPTTPNAPLASGIMGNYILSDAESDDWAAYYTPSDTYFKVTIPIHGAIKLRYRLADGGAFTIFLKTTKPLTHEIGLKTINGVTDVVDCVTVEYVEQGAFAQMPTDLVIEEQGDGYIQYERKTGDSDTEEWWPETETDLFVMNGNPMTMQIISGGVVVVAQGNAASRPVIAAPTASCIVTTEADSGAGSLRNVLDAKTCSTITFAPGIATINIADFLTVAHNVTVDGGSGVTFKLLGRPCLVIAKNTNVTLSGLIITGATNNGGVCNSGTLLIDSNTTITGNAASFGSGGIWNSSTGMLTLNGTVSGNNGGIENDGRLIVNGSVINNNTSAGIVNTGVLTLNGTVSNNTGGGIRNVDGTLTINGIVSDNSDDDHGGGIYFTSGTLIFGAGHRIERNHADNDDDGSGQGGGIFFYDSGTIIGIPNYGSNNYRGSGTGTIDNCSGWVACP